MRPLRRGAHGNSAGHRTPLSLCADGPDAVMTNDENTALLLGAIYRLCEGDVSKLLHPEPVSGEIESFLDSGPSMGARRAALVVILQSIINDQS